MNERAFLTDLDAPSLGMSPRSFREAVRRQGIPHRQLGRRMIVAMDDLLPMTAGRRREPVLKKALPEPDLLAELGLRRIA